MRTNGRPVNSFCRRRRDRTSVRNVSVFLQDPSSSSRKKFLRVSTTGEKTLVILSPIYTVYVKISAHFTLFFNDLISLLARKFRLPSLAVLEPHRENITRLPPLARTFPPPLFTTACLAGLTLLSMN